MNAVLQIDKSCSRSKAPVLPFEKATSRTEKSPLEAEKRVSRAEDSPPEPKNASLRTAGGDFSDEDVASSTG